MEAPPCFDGFMYDDVFENGLYYNPCILKTRLETDTERTMSGIISGLSMLVLLSICILTTGSLSAQSARRRWWSRSRGVSYEEIDVTSSA